MPPAGNEKKPRAAAEDHRAKTAHEADRISRKLVRSAHPAPAGDPASGLMLLVEPPAGPRALDALRRSLDRVNLPEAYVTWSSTGLLAEELLALEPAALVAVGPGAAREIDALDHPLARNRFATAAEGSWFAWTPGTAGLLLPPLAPALHDDRAKRRFWHAFLALRSLQNFA